MKKKTHSRKSSGKRAGAKKIKLVSSKAKKPTARLVVKKSSKPMLRLIAKASSMRRPTVFRTKI